MANVSHHQQFTEVEYWKKFRHDKLPTEEAATIRNDSDFCPDEGEGAYSVYATSLS
jgi:hypothetical protein